MNAGAAGAAGGDSGVPADPGAPGLGEAEDTLCGSTAAVGGCPLPCGGGVELKAEATAADFCGCGVALLFEFSHSPVCGL